MKSKNSYLGVNPIIVQQIRFHAKRLKQHKCFVEYDLEDIEQELLCDIWSYLDQYDKNRGAFSTFITKLVQSRANNLLHKQLCIKRNIVYFIADIDCIPDTKRFDHEVIIYTRPLLRNGILITRYELGQSKDQLKTMLQVDNTILNLILYFF